MPKSQNGWDVTFLASATTPLRWITGRVLTGDVHTVFDRFCKEFHETVEPINPAHSWGWVARPVRGTTSTWSNHSSGTAIDLNAPAHPLGKRGTFTPRQVKAIEALLKRYPIIEWGGHWSGRADEMHFEIKGTPAKLKAFLKSGESSAKPWPYWGDSGPLVERAQTMLNTLDAVTPKLKVDGQFGSATLKAVKQFEASQPDLRADGSFGAKSWARLIGLTRKAKPKSFEVVTTNIDKSESRTALTAAVKAVREELTRPPSVWLLQEAYGSTERLIEKAGGWQWAAEYTEGASPAIAWNMIRWSKVRGGRTKIHSGKKRDLYATWVVLLDTYTDRTVAFISVQGKVGRTRRPAQWAALTRLQKKLEAYGPVIIGGDFRSTTGPASLIGQAQRKAGYTRAVSTGVDALFSKGVKTTGTKIVPKAALRDVMDHPAVAATFKPV